MVKDLLISHSSRMFWNQCHKKYYWSQVKRLEPKIISTAMIRGSTGHMLVDKWNANKEGADELVQLANGADYFLGNGLREYFKKYKDDDVHYLEMHRAFAIEIGVFPGRYEDSYRVFYTGEVDGVGLWNGHRVVVERKFTQQMPSDFIARFQLDDQVRGYSWAMEQMGFPNDGALVDIVGCKKIPECVRDFIPVDRTAKDSFFFDLAETITEIVSAISDSRFPMSPHSCFARGECPFRLLCLNTDREQFADSMGYFIKEPGTSHEEVTFVRANDIKPTTT